MFTGLLAASPPWPVLLAGAAMVFAAGTLRGYTGFGFSIAAVPLLSLLGTPATVVPIVLMLQLVVSANGIRAAARLSDRRSIGLLAGGALAATPVGLWALTELPDAVVRLTIAGTVSAAVLVLGLGLRPATAPSGPRVLLFGVASGLFNGVAGMPGPPVIAYYLGAPIPAATARASMIVLFTLTSAFALVPLLALGRLHVGYCLLAAAALPVVWLGSSLGAWLHARSLERTYRTAGLTVLAATAALAAVRAISSIV